MIRSRPSLRNAIEAKCKDCIYDPLCPGTWRAQVAACTCTNCALWPHRATPHKGQVSLVSFDPVTAPKTAKDGTYG